MSKLFKARSLLHRRQILQENIRWKALDEIYKIYTYASFGEKNRTSGIQLLWKKFEKRTFAPLESNRKTMKSAAGKRPPDMTHSAPEKKLSSRISCA